MDRLLRGWEANRQGVLTPRLQFIVSDELFFRASNFERDRQEHCWLLILRVRFESASDHFFVEGFVDNVSDEDVVNTKLLSAQILGRPLVTAYDPPRRWGMRLGLSWWP